MSERIQALSLFSGAGGLDIGFHQAGYHIQACVEIDPRYAATLASNVGPDRYFGEGTEVISEDVTKIDVDRFRDVGIELVIGGPPCQTFSAAGRRAGGVIGTGDARGQLFKRFCEIVEVVRPKVFVFENVYGLPGANGGEPWRAILAAFSKLGYHLSYEILDAADYGVPQHRERLILVGGLDKSFVFPLPTHGPDSGGRLPLRSVRDAITDLQDPNEKPSKGPGGLYGHLLPAVPPGLNYSYFTAEMGHPKPVFAWRSKFHDLLYKVNPDYPCRTLKAQPGKFTGPFHWHNRHFTIPELKRLQTFPDDYHIEGSPNVVLEQIGNSVPPRMARVIAEAISDQLIRPRDNGERHARRPSGFKSTFRTRQRERSKKFKEIAARELRRQVDDGTLLDEPRVFDENYRLATGDFFDAKKLDSDVTIRNSFAEVEVMDRGDTIKISYVAAKIDSKEGSVRISGLGKYLDRIDNIHVSCNLESPRDVFFLWWVIQDAMIQRSRFFTLIDVYGHYANRGDTVVVEGSYGLGKDRPVARALDFFLTSSRCGGFWDRKALKAQLEVSDTGLDSLVRKLRDLRMDIRTRESHPILGQDRVICTYPFPLLSPRALVLSKARLSVEDQAAL